MRFKALLQRWVWLVVRKQYIEGRFHATTFRLAPTTGNEAHVIMCLWNRPARIRPILDMLNDQDYPNGVRLFLWNNKRADHAEYLSGLRQFEAGAGALRRVDIVKSVINFGSIGRFFWARRIEATKSNSPIIVIDDDQDFDATFVREAIRAYDPGAVKAWWAWTVGDSYWTRQPAGADDRVDHVGPGGSVCSSRIFADKRFFTDIPDEFRMLDDIWLTYFAKQAGLRLAKLPVEMTFVMDETNQFHGQTDLKPRFYDSLYR
ncbi:MAG: hypothetical protein JWL94_1523 [Microbacteriaceae bacterium]|nr:hypothetical protein [Microbacteriaceae bacterium]